MLEITSANQHLLVDLNEEDAETISGGYEVFTVKNKTNYNVGYSVDNKSWTHKPNESWIWTAHSGGTIKFDVDGRADVTHYKSYNLANGGIYEFQDNKSTSGNPYDIELYSVA
jgi:hypothetical protein